MTERVQIKVPDIGDFHDVEVIEILVKPGDAVRPEQSLITLESDKASMEIPSPMAGIVRELRVKLNDEEQDILASKSGPVPEQALRHQIKGREAIVERHAQEFGQQLDVAYRRRILRNEALQFIEPRRGRVVALELEV